MAIGQLVWFISFFSSDTCRHQVPCPLFVYLKEHSEDSAELQQIVITNKAFQINLLQNTVITCGLILQSF